MIINDICSHILKQDVEIRISPGSRAINASWSRLFIHTILSQIQYIDILSASNSSCDAMASVKIFSLAVKTLAKPIANTIKAQAAEHETFRNICIGLAQRMHRTEARMRMGLLNEEAKNIKPLNDTRAVQNGATTLAETFLFLVGAGLVLGESYRSSRKEGKRRDMVAERLDGLEEEIRALRATLQGGGAWEKGLLEVRQQNEQTERVLATVIHNGLKAGWMSLGHDPDISHTLPLIDPGGRRADSIGAGGGGTVLQDISTKANRPPIISDQDQIS
ncbi:optic atrophy 3 protein-domain-containing protein [Naematelia encephala]|uniref:Optic atrophy 3 protein-domain-containing protein n=1 Tax=Naematelia encephala TaxID=71784 RepID=A0A1Y2AQ46_9TREE|nr:optic atrophy 3 protein-domain-containing protein [Naematelia encephala]